MALRDDSDRNKDFEMTGPEAKIWKRTEPEQEKYIRAKTKKTRW